MRKKWLAAGVGFGVGAVLFVAGGYSAMANTSGYDVYKDALKNTKAETNVTAHAELAVTDNGKTVLSGTALGKLDRGSEAGSAAGTFNDGEQTRAFNAYLQDGKAIFKSSEQDVYKVTDRGSFKWGQGGPNPPIAVEHVIDALMGNMKGLATAENEPDGGKLASLHLSGSQIPAIVNAIGALAVSKHGGIQDQEQPICFPKLTDNVKVEALNFDAKISPDNVLEEQSAEIDVSGSDEQGNPHELAIRLHVNFSDYGRTVPDRIDLTGKPTEIVENHWANHGGWHH